MSILSEFRAFAMRGNVVDLAIGVVIGTAFGAITNSLVKDVIMPPIAAVMGNVNFTNMKWVIAEAAGEAAEISINYGMFLQALVNFLIVAWAMFVVVKMMNKMKRKQEEGAADAPPPPRQEVLLEEIRDLLKK